jgi:SOS-response transcriptional repressor LexA
MHLARGYSSNKGAHVRGAAALGEHRLPRERRRYQKGANASAGIYLLAHLVSNVAMDVSEIRRRNLKLIIKQEFNGVAVSLARALGKQPSEISRIFSANQTHRRNVGSRFARQVESQIGRPVGWMDQDQTARERSTSADRRGSHEATMEIRRRIPLVSAVQADDPGAERRSKTAENWMLQSAIDWITTTAPVGERAYAMRVIGDSMEPKFPEGVTIVVDPDVQPAHGSFVVALLKDTGQPTFKQLVMDGRRYLKPLNPRYPIMEVDKRISLCGVVRQMIMTFD